MVAEFGAALSLRQPYIFGVIGSPREARAPPNSILLFVAGRISIPGAASYSIVALPGAYNTPLSGN